MENKKNYSGLDVLKFIMALLVMQRHIIQIFFQESSRWRIVIGSWLSNLPVPVFFTIAGFFLFRKFDREKRNYEPVLHYCMRILKLYIIWSILYLPIDFYNWYHEEGHAIKTGLLRYAHRFLFDSTTPQLWYLPALLFACLLVWLLYTCGMKPGWIMTFGLFLFAVGTIGNNWYFNQRLPVSMQSALGVYTKYLITMRNGLFYGTFFVALGLFLAKTKWRPPLWVAVSGAAAGVLACGFEATHFYEVNFVFLTAPTAYFLFAAAEQLPLPKPESKVYPRLRGMSEWIYFSHFYFFYVLVWTRVWNPIPFNSKSVTVMIVGAVLMFSWGMVRFSETKTGAFLKKII